jgi:signal transduction histidine kinase
MASLRDLSFPRKIVAIAMIISTSALLLAGAALIGYDFFAARSDLGAGTTIFAQIVADNATAAVAFNDQPAAVEILNSLRSESSIVSSCIYKGVELLAQRAGAGGRPCPRRAVSAEAEKEEAGFIAGNSPIVLKGEQIGSVRLLATLAPVYTRLRVAIIVLAGIFIISVLFALILSSRLHRVVSEPIMNLAETAKTVSSRKDYSLRAEKRSEDELGMLVESFNEMLEQIQAREAELIQANKTKDEFLMTLSHELRTPLTPILGWTKLLLQREVDPARARSAIQTIDRSAQLQARLIDDLLDVARITAGKLSMDLTDLDLLQIVEGAVESAIPAIKEKHLALESNLEKVPVIRGNATRLQQVIWNLLSNSIKFTPEGGLVRVALKRVRSNVELTVSDTGVGIQQEFLPFVFERFRQADSSYTRKHGGLGIGLAIVKHVVHQHGGSVGVRSEGENKGTTFTLRFPVPIETSGEILKSDYSRISDPEISKH